MHLLPGGAAVQLHLLAHRSAACHAAACIRAARRTGGLPKNRARWHTRNPCLQHGGRLITLGVGQDGSKANEWVGGKGLAPG